MLLVTSITELSCYHQHLREILPRHLLDSLVKPSLAVSAWAIFSEHPAEGNWRTLSDGLRCPACISAEAVCLHDERQVGW